MKNLLGVCCLALVPTAPGPVSWRIWSRSYAWIFFRHSKYGCWENRIVVGIAFYCSIDKLLTKQQYLVQLHLCLAAPATGWLRSSVGDWSSCIH